MQTKRVKLILLLAILLLMVTSVTWNLTLNTKELSPRAQEFLKKNYPNFKEAPIKDNSNTVYFTECFQVQIPYISSNPKLEKEDKKCVFRAKVLKPQSQIVVFNETLLDDINTHPSISMRRLYQKTYTETSLVDARYQKILRFDTKDSVVFFAKENTNLITIAFSSLSNPTNIKNEDIIKILNSFKFL